MLQSMLDPKGADPALDRLRFHAIMNSWIHHCSQQREDSSQTAAELETESVRGAEFCPSDPEPYDSPSQVQLLQCELAEVKHVCQALRYQNVELMRAVTHSDDLNLQLTMEMTESRSKLTSAQLAEVRVESLCEELDEVRQALRESQDQQALSQDAYNSLVKENENLTAELKAVEEKSERWGLERSLSEEQLNKLRKANTRIKAELEECHLLVAIKDSEASKKTVLLEHLKNLQLQSHRNIEGLQAELLRLQEQSRKTLHRLESQSLYGPLRRGGASSNHHSLRQELHSLQTQGGGVEEGVAQAGGASDLHPTLKSIINRIKAHDLSHCTETNAMESMADTEVIQETPSYININKQLLISLLCKVEQQQRAVCVEHVEVHSVAMTSRGHCAPTHTPLEAEQEHTHTGPAAAD
ncbi:inositol 1,4,5-triphosphate receptor associated 2-like [Alosa alosa]|uniref:inositol 1,4,5-triphosphate receptor associated 2-like n=1 Tax=Alosa alosa TaxID=278164 RepID=UPI0020152621|nr:inositol 1,4,5-triphosphate receptor associated 2-like [Alosa alosa]